MSSEESRYTLNGALLVLQPGRSEMVATDGSRLSLAVRGSEVVGLKSEERMLVPRRALGAVRRLAEAQESDTPIKIARDDSHLLFSAADSIVITRPMSGQFPNYEAVLLQDLDDQFPEIPDDAWPADSPLHPLGRVIHMADRSFLGQAVDGATRHSCQTGHLGLRVTGLQ